MFNRIDSQYVNLINKIVRYGTPREDRTGVGTQGIFGYNMEFDLRDHFPIVSLKETRWKVAFLEMLWFLRGESHTQYLHDHGSKLWDAWADAHGNLGPVYGVNWRKWPDYEGGSIDQVANLIDGLRNNQHGRRHIVTAWNVTDLPQMALPPCHHSHQCYVDNGYLDLKLFLRSSDVMLGLPFNICGYALLTHLYARAAGLEARRLLVDIGDAHIYSNHFDGALEVVNRANEPNAFGAPLLNIKTSNIDIDGYKPDDFEVLYYNPKPHIKLEVAV